MQQKAEIWSLRLSVRTRGFHPRKRGSIPLGTAIMKYYVYLLVTKHKNRIISYVGYTNNINKRLNLHNNSKGAKFTKGKFWKLAYVKRYSSKNLALKEEYKLKKNYRLRKYIKLRYLDKINNSI